MKIKYLVRHVTSRELISLDLNKNSKQAVELMLANNIGSVLVTEYEKPVGIVTDRDVLKRGGLLQGINICVGTYMSTPLVTIDVDAPIGEAAEVMEEKDIRRLIVVENEEIVGIVTQKDLLKGTFEAFNFIRLLGM